MPKLVLFFYFISSKKAKKDFILAKSLRKKMKLMYLFLQCVSMIAETQESSQ